jgi:hypothetical protein
MTVWSRRRFCVTAAFAGVGCYMDAAAQEESFPDDGTWSKHPVWRTLKTTKLTTDARGMVHAEIPTAVHELAGRSLVVSGFILPLSAQAQSTHFILSRYSPECSFCPGGAPNEVIEVFASKPMRAASHMVFLRGRFAVQNKVEDGLFFRLEQAVVA